MQVSKICSIVEVMLIVEDDQDLRNVYAAQMRRLGMSCDTARNVDEALALLSQKPYKVVLMDISLSSDIDGLEATKIIREKYPDVCIVAVTSHDCPRECFDAGMDAYYQKPIMLDDLQEIAEKYSQGGCHPDSRNRPSQSKRGRKGS